MSGSLPAMVDPIRLADENVRLRGELSASPMRRLAEVCVEPMSPVRIDLAFDRDPQGLRRMVGSIEAEVCVTCQRCLRGLCLTLQAEPELIVLTAAQRDVLPDETDVLVVDKPLALAQLVEDELLLALPMIPMHDLAECEGAVQATRASEDKQSPFAGLSGLKKHK